MLRIQDLRQDPAAAKKRLAHRNFPQPELVDEALRLDDERKRLQTERDQVQSQAKTMATDIGRLLGQAKADPAKAAEAETAKAATADLKQRVKTLEAGYQDVEAKLETVLLDMPNLPHASVPFGRTAEDNEVVREGGVKPQLPDGAKAHWDLTDQYGLIDFDMGVKLAGSGFPVYIGQGAKLQRALIHWFLAQAAEAGYTEYMPSVLVNEESARGTGQLPDKEGQMYQLTDERLYLIPTAEVPLTNMYRDVILKESDLPRKMTGHTSCFRREAGSYGKDVRGLNRLHQFEKVEIVQVVHPEGSYAVQDEMVAHVERLIQKLELPYRILRLCGGDTGFTSALTFDFEVWSAGQGRWLEVSSISNFETFQANRLKLRFADADNKKHLAHTLNGSALALPRIMAAILENYQLEDGKGIVVPEVLRPFMGQPVIQ